MEQEHQHGCVLAGVPYQGEAVSTLGGPDRFRVVFFVLLARKLLAPILGMC
jgi:hypothetical protein